MSKNSKDHYKIVGVVILVLLLLAFVMEYRFDKDNKHLLIGILVFGVLMYSFEKLALLFSKYWMKFAKVLGDFNSKIILSVFFLLILTPVALLKKISTKKTAHGDSTWKSVEADVPDFKKPW